MSGIIAMDRTVPVKKPKPCAARPRKIREGFFQETKNGPKRGMPVLPRSRGTRAMTAIKRRIVTTILVKLFKENAAIIAVRNWSDKAFRIEHAMAYMR